MKCPVLLSAPPCVLHEDEHILVVNKPASLNTHSPSPYAGEGIYEWLRNREPRWAELAIVHRLDKSTSGLIAFGKNRTANQSLTAQFATRKVRKRYLLLASNAPKEKEFTARSGILRQGERYVPHESGEPAETRFIHLGPQGAYHLIAAEPFTGRTHQIRVHAALKQIAIIGDTLYGGRKFHRVCLHAQELSFRHPATNQRVTFTAEPEFFLPLQLAVRAALLDVSASTAAPETTAYRLIHGAADGFPELYIDRWGEYVLVESAVPPAALGHLYSEAETIKLKIANGTYVPERIPSPAIRTSQGSHIAAAEAICRRSHRAIPSDRAREFAKTRDAAKPSGGPFAFDIDLPLRHRAVYHKLLTRQIRRKTTEEASPRCVSGAPAAESFNVRENGVTYEISFERGYSVGLFLDQRDNRRRLLNNYIAPDFPVFPDGLAGKQVLNTFAYTCGFSVCAAISGAITTGLDLSKRYLDWGKRNFVLNNLDPAAHDFIYGNVFDWARRLAKRNRQFDLIILDPPTFSHPKSGEPFQVEKDFGKLVGTILPLLAPDGVLFCSTNAQKLTPEAFLNQLRGAIIQSGSAIKNEKFIPQPPDFPISREEPAHLKSAWIATARH